MPYLLLFKPLAHIATVANMNLTFKNLHMNHSSQSHGLCLVKYANETLQNLSYFMYYENPKLHFCYSFILYYVVYFFPVMNDIKSKNKASIRKSNMK